MSSLTGTHSDRTFDTIEISEHAVGTDGDNTQTMYLCFLSLPFPTGPTSPNSVATFPHFGVVSSSIASQALEKPEFLGVGFT